MLAPATAAAPRIAGNLPPRFLPFYPPVVLMEIILFSVTV